MFNNLLKFISILFLAATTPISALPGIIQQQKVTPTQAVHIDQVSESKVLDVINTWEKSQGYQPYILDNQLCNIASKRVGELQGNWAPAVNLNSYNEASSYANLAENSSKDNATENSILSSWLNNPSTKKNLTDYFNYSCIRCSKNLCVQILGNRNSNTANYRCTGSNSGQTILVKNNNDCQKNYTDCALNDGSWKLMTKSDCNVAQGKTNSTNQTDNGNQGNKTTWNGKENCASSGSGYSYNFGELTIAECTSKIQVYFASKNLPYVRVTPVVYVSPTSAPSNNQPSIDTTACYNQYNTDVQRANNYGGNVGSAMKDMAQNNLSYCLSSGHITAVGTVQQDTRPKDRDGKLCSEYPPELLGYSKEMGCP